MFLLLQVCKLLGTIVTGEFKLFSVIFMNNMNFAQMGI